MGIAHHSNYAVWFESGRTELFKQLGYPYSALEKHGYLLPLTGLQCSFMKPVRYEDDIVVVTSVSRVSYVRVAFLYSIMNKDNTELMATGETSHAWTDKELRPINIKKESLALFESLMSAWKGN